MKFGDIQVTEVIKLTSSAIYNKIIIIIIIII